MKYFINICGKRTEVTKEEFEKHFPPVTETESNNDSNGVIEPNS